MAMCGIGLGCLCSADQHAMHKQILNGASCNREHTVVVALRACGQFLGTFGRAKHSSIGKGTTMEDAMCTAGVSGCHEHNILSPRPDGLEQLPAVGSLCYLSIQSSNENNILVCPHAPNALHRYILT